MGTAIKHPVPDQMKPLFVIFDIQAERKIALQVGIKPEISKYYVIHKE